MKRVLFISTLFPYPIDNGKKVVIAGLVKYFTEKYGKSNVDYILIGDELSTNNGLYFNNCFKIEKTNFIKKIRNVIWNSLIVKNK
ncbi:hypothetical protein, partial [Neobacillus drentensis]|uniref:hypothetical protein n=1 Tax=Neobacillus drentensis TaxID=220684 RepID=UPI003002429A